MDTDQGTPYSGLTPDCVLDALDSIGLRADGRLLGLNSYENRVYQIWLEDGPDLTSGQDSTSGPNSISGPGSTSEPGSTSGPGTTSGPGSASGPGTTSCVVVAKFYRPGRWSNEQIAEEHEFVRELAERELPVVAPLRQDGKTLHEFGGYRFAVYPKRGGRAPELEQRETLEWMGRFIGRIHAVGALAPFRTRPALDLASFGLEPRDYLLSHGFIPADLTAAWTSVTAQALEGVRRCYARAGAVNRLRLHGDCHAGNVLWIDSAEAHGPHFVDFDDARMGPAVQDLWMLLSGERADMVRQLADLLAGYEDFHEFDVRELHLVEALRTLRLIHYSAWIARRWDDPAFPAAFPWFNTQRYWQDRILELREQIALMDEPPLWLA